MNKISCPACNGEASFFITSYKKRNYYECYICHLIFQHPSHVDEYEDKLWTNSVDPDGKTRNITEERNFKIKNWYGDIIQFIKKIPPGKVIDIGCGLGYLLSEFPDLWQKFGYEISNFARTFIQQNFANITIVNDLNLAESQPMERHVESYDVVICYHVIEHISNPNLFFKHLSMLVKPNGLLIIGTPNMGCIAAKLFKGNFRLLDDSHLSLFSNKTLTKLIENNNFTIIKKEYPYFKTAYFSLRNILRMFNLRTISPPFYGNIMTFYARKNYKQKIS